MIKGIWPLTAGLVPATVTKCERLQGELIALGVSREEVERLSFDLEQMLIALGLRDHQIYIDRMQNMRDLIACGVTNEQLDLWIASGAPNIPIAFYLAIHPPGPPA